MQYFESYGDLDVHKLMLEDSVRNEAYRKAIMDNSSAIRGKVVMDVGAGTGVLSVLCAQAGAAKVYAIEASDAYKLAQEVIRENGFENIVEVVHDQVENLVLPGDTKVDVIVSEWMGFYLLHEGMLDSVIYARDNFLKMDGLMFPESAALYAAPCSIPTMNDIWESVAGVSMKSFARRLRQNASKKPEVLQTSPSDLLSTPDLFVWLDMKEVTRKDLDRISVRPLFVSTRSGRYQGLMIYFTCTFPSDVTEPVVLSTDPDDPPTHWKQTVIVFPEETTVEEKEPIAAEIVLARSNDNNRRYDIEVTMLDPSEVEHPEYCNCYMTKCILAKAVLEKYEKHEF